MKAVIHRVSRLHRVALEEVDISGSPELERAYGQEIPVLVVDGRKAAKYRLAEADLLRLLEARTD
jgi:hypothetical protein